jgi:hypothetical protein
MRDVIPVFSINGRRHKVFSIASASSTGTPYSNSGRTMPFPSPLIAGPARRTRTVTPSCEAR